MSGNTTLLVGTSDDKVDHVIEVVKQYSKLERNLFLIQSLMKVFFASYPIEVQVGGATILWLTSNNLLRYKKKEIGQLCGINLLCYFKEMKIYF